MGTLTPGASYIYERNGDVIYARETGSTERRVIGYTNNKSRDVYRELETFKELVSYAHLHDDPELKDMLEQVKVYYYLKKKSDAS